MKKVGIMTYHRACNYGAQVQSYALITHLKKKYPEASFEIIDYQAKSERNYYRKSVIRNAIKCGPAAAWAEMRRNRQMKRFASTLPLSKKKIISDNVEKLFSCIKDKYDLVIVGSDAIFNWKMRVFPTAYFLGASLGCKKASYAASAHGMKYLNEGSEKIDYCKSALADFDYIGVRDTHTEKFVKYCNEDVCSHHNCDPSLFLDMDSLDYNAIERNLRRDGIDLSKPLILVMSADPKIAKPICDRFSSECEIVSLYLKNPAVQKHICDLTPLEWAGVFKFARVTVTEYFHGTLLSLKNGTPTVAIDRTDYRGGYIGKIRDVLYERMGLEDMYFNYFEVKDGVYADRAVSMCEKVLASDESARIAAAIEKEVQQSESFFDFLNEIVG